MTAAVLAREFDVSKRTIQRDLATLAAMGAPIEGEAGVGYLLRPGFLLPPLMFKEEELEALALGGRWVAQRADADLARAADDALAKIAAVLPPPLTTSLETPSLVSAPIVAKSEDSVDPSLLRSAIRRQRKLCIAYANEDGQRSKRTIWPIALVFFDTTRVLAAWCELRQDFRHFRTDRIASAVVLDDRFPGRRSAMMDEWRARDAASRQGRTRFAGDRI